MLYNIGTAGKGGTMSSMTQKNTVDILKLDPKKQQALQLLQEHNRIAFAASRRIRKTIHEREQMNSHKENDHGRVRVA